MADNARPQVAALDPGIFGADFSESESKYFETAGQDGGPGETQAPLGTEAPIVTQPPVTTTAPTVTVAPTTTSAPTPEVTDAAGQKVVPLSALHESREEVKAAKARETQLQEQMNTMLSRFNDLLALKRDGEAPAKPKEPEVVIPPLDTNPIGHFQAQIAVLSKALQDLSGTVKTGQTQTQEQQQVTALFNWAEQQERQYMAEAPEYADALNHLRDVRVGQLNDLGITDEKQILQTLQTEIFQIAQQAQKQGQNPAKIIHSLSKRMGFQPKAPAAAAAPAVTAASAAALESPEAAVKRLAAGHEQADGLGGRGGTAPAPLTAEAALRMSDAQFAALMETAEGKALLGV